MQKVQDIKMYYYFDEAGTPQILGRKGVNLIKKSVTSKTFMVGYLEIKDAKEFTKKFKR